jgi:transposase
LAEKLPTRKERVIAALLEESSIAKAAERCGLSERTVRRWLQRDDFRQAFDQAKRTIMESTVARLTATSEKAVGALAKNVECGNPGTEVKAANVILSQVARLAELEDLQHRVEVLEGLLSEKQP